MAVRAMNGSAILRCCVASPPIAAVKCCLHRCKTVQFHRGGYSTNSGLRLSIFEINYGQVISFGNGSVSIRKYSASSFADMVMEELALFRKRVIVRASNKLELESREEIFENKSGKRTLQKGFLLEFKKDPERVLLAVAQKPDGKKNWMVSDQNGTMTSIKPQQITFIVPGVENFDYTEISDFVQRAKSNLDPTLLEFAWLELLEKNKSVRVEELAEMIFGCADPLECYCAHLLLSMDDVYFAVLDSKGSSSVYRPRPAVQVEELLRKKRTKKAAEKEFKYFVKLLKSAREMPPHSKPTKSSWMTEEKTRHRIEALEAYAIDDFMNEDRMKTAGMILKAVGLDKTSSAAVGLLIDIGYFPVHINLDLLKLNIRTDFREEILAAAESILLESPDTDKDNRVDLTQLKVYAIDVDEADELDDALSATRLQDGRIKVWIHVADPTSLVQPGSMIDKAAMSRSTSIFLPTATYPMFPVKLAMDGMSLKQGVPCNAVTVSVVLHSDGSIAEYLVENSIIRPTYMLTYESATELLYLNLEEEAELRLLSEAARLRLNWRLGQGAIETATIDTRIKVTNPDDPEPLIRLYVENQADPAMRLVTEMMILCGEVIATFGYRNGIPLPYRGQRQSDLDISAFSHLPQGPVRSSALVKILRAAEMDFRNPIRHGVLGIPGYVQFTSPIRRYMDLVAHYQVKAFLRGDSLPFSPGQMEGIASLVNMNTRMVRKLCTSSLRYWIIEYLRRQPKERKFTALVLRFIKDRAAAVLLTEVGFQSSVWVSDGVRIGHEVKVQVKEAHPRNDVIVLKEFKDFIPVKLVE